MDSLSELYRELRAPVFRFLCRLGCNPEEAEELTQESFLQALLSLPRYRGAASVRTWLFGIARNVYLKRTARDGRHARLIEPPGAEPGPAAALEARERAELVTRALGALPEPQRAVLILREYEELPYAEIATIIGRSETWCRVTCHRAKGQLRTIYLELSGGEAP